MNNIVTPFISELKNIINLNNFILIEILHTKIH